MLLTTSYVETSSHARYRRVLHDGSDGGVMFSMLLLIEGEAEVPVGKWFGKAYSSGIFSRGIELLRRW